MVLALLLGMGVLVARAGGLSGARATLATQRPDGKCELSFSGYYLVDEAIVPGHTLSCWDDDWNLQVPGPRPER
jgi:hypothetical protein